MESGQAFITLYNGQTAVLNVNESDTIANLKATLSDLYGICGDYSLFNGLCEAQDDDTVLDEDSKFVYLQYHQDMCGGGKKRKKKQYTTPKKVKHKKKKVKLAVLKFYKVEGKDKVVRLLKECPGESCGSGVFMASHHNRSYCGRCGLTYILNNAE